MRPLQPGDVCEGRDYRNWPELNGMQCQILAPARYVIGTDPRTKEGKEGLMHEVVFANGYRCFAEPRHLRRIPPKDNPKSDFLPADEDFTRDLLKQLGRVSA